MQIRQRRVEKAFSLSNRSDAALNEQLSYRWAAGKFFCQLDL